VELIQGIIITLFGAVLNHCCWPLWLPIMPCLADAGDRLTTGQAFCSPLMSAASERAAERAELAPWWKRNDRRQFGQLGPVQGGTARLLIRSHSLEFSLTSRFHSTNSQK
jgi:hypothetical protein